MIVTVRPRYACRRCDAGVVQADTPNSLIQGGLPTEGTLAHVAVSKYADHLPLYRQCQIYARGWRESGPVNLGKLMWRVSLPSSPGR